MTFTIDADLEAYIRRIAALRGLDANQYATALLVRGVEQDAKQDAQELTTAQIDRLHEAIRRGIADEEAGRVKPLAQVVAEVREKYGLPDTWAAGADD